MLVRVAVVGSTSPSRITDAERRASRRIPLVRWSYPVGRYFRGVIALDSL